MLPSGNHLSALLDHGKFGVLEFVAGFPLPPKNVRTFLNLQMRRFQLLQIRLMKTFINGILE